MVLFEHLILEAGSPIYAQIIRYVKRGVMAGTIENGQEMPSRRVLSALLGVNPNTIQKAYRLLEEEGIIESRSGAKSYMTIDEERKKTIRSELLQSEAAVWVAAMKQMGMTKMETLELVDALWEEERGTVE